MSIYSDIISTDLETGQVLSIPVTNEWVLANKSKRVHLALDNSTIFADGVDSAVLTAQLQTPLLINGQQNNIPETITITILFGDERFDLELVNGYAEEIVTCVTPDNYIITCDTLPSNTIVLTGA